MSEPRRVHCHVSGRVHGVYFRASTQQEARALGLSGWVRNLSDGRVELMAEGPAAAIQQLLTWARRGPPAARVESVEVLDVPATGNEADFAIRR